MQTAHPFHYLLFSYEYKNIINFESKGQENICINLIKLTNNDTEVWIANIAGILSTFA